MKALQPKRLTLMATLFAASLGASILHAQQQNRPPQVTSPEVGADRKVTFRILAPKAEVVKIGGGDIPGIGESGTMTKGTNGVWEVIVGPVNPGAYRYNFNVDGLAVIDPRSPEISESNNNVWSLVQVPGAAFMDTLDVPHGAVAAVTYYSKSLGKFRRMHVYTPPGYESGKGKFPVFYLLHGASDSDDSWSSVGRAGIILDNLIAAGKAKPMIVVMPAGHTRTGPTPRPTTPAGGAPAQPVADEFVQDFEKDLLPFVEKNFRVHADRKNRAIAGLSMGGAQTLSLGVRNLKQFGYLGVFSSGVFGITGRNRDGTPLANSGPSWAEQNHEALANAKAKNGLKLFWFATGKDDFLLETTRATVAMLKQHQFDVVYHETEGAHTWMVWRAYLDEFAPQLFQ